MQKSVFGAKFVVHCDAYCHKVKNKFIYIFKTVLFVDIKKFSTDLSKRGV